MHDYVEFLKSRLAEARMSGVRKTARTEMQIEIATATLLGTNGYHSISVDAIADAADLAHGTFYRYFAGKREVVAKTLTDYFEFVRATRPRVPPTASDFEAVMIGMSHYIRCFSHNVGLMRCHFHLKDEDDAIADVDRIANLQMSDRVIRRVRRSRAVGEAEIPQLRLRIFCLISMVDELLLKVYGRNKPALQEYASDPNLIARTLSEVWHAALYENGVLRDRLESV